MSFFTLLIVPNQKSISLEDIYLCKPAAEGNENVLLPSVFPIGPMIYLSLLTLYFSYSKNHSLRELLSEELAQPW